MNCESEIFDILPSLMILSCFAFKIDCHNIGNSVNFKFYMLSFLKEKDTISPLKMPYHSFNTT